MHKLERGTTLIDAFLFSTFIDWMTLVCQSNYIGLAYSEFADDILKFLETTTSGISRIDKVFQVYWSSSIKNGERYQRPVGKINLKTIMGAVASKQRGAVLSDGNNKTELIKLILHHWKWIFLQLLET